jgi:hypothetical protein
MPIKDQTTPTVVPGRNIRSIIEGARPVSMKGEDTADTNVQSTSSFFYDPPTLGLKSTQQLNVDWSRFENHTFFNSAEVNVNVAFDQIINNFPFDGTRREVESFFEKLTGWERYVYDRFPKNVGYLFFSGTRVGEDTNGTKGTWISVNDYAGGMLPDLSKTKTGLTVVDPQTKSFSIELQLFVPAQQNSGSVVCQKMSAATQGFNLRLEPTSSTTTCVAKFTVVSGGISLETSASLTKGQFNHVCVVYNRESSLNRLEFFNNEQLAATSATTYAFPALAIASSPLIIGSGSAITVNGVTTTPTTTLSGAIDEFRLFHSVRTQAQQLAYAKKSVFASSDLKVYYKFNEPTGTLGANTSDQINRVVLDSSGNSLHGFISPAISSFKLRNTASMAPPMTYEKVELSPVLFPSFADVVDLNVDLLTSATAYDQQNPNIITKLIPPHYFLEGQSFDGLETEGGEIGETYTGTGDPRSGKLGTTQLLLTFLYTWAKFFDELKQFVDAFSTVNFVDYNTQGTSPDHFLPIVMKQFGFQLPPFFLDASIEQYIDAENIQPVISTDQHSLQYIQNQILRRVLSNMTEIIRSKGTQHSVKAFLRSVGIDPNNSFRIREFGGPTERQLKNSREIKSEPCVMLDFSSGGYIISPTLSGSRLETGYPNATGPFVQKTAYPPHGISSNPNDGLYTSGSFTFEGMYQFPRVKGLSNLTQSLARMFVDVTASNGPSCIFNMVALSGSATTPAKLRLYGRSTAGSDLSTAPLLTLELTGCNIFDGNKWNVSWGRTRADQAGSLVSSSFFLRAGRQDYGEIKELWQTSSFFLMEGTSPLASSSLQTKNASINASGSWLEIGNRDLAGTFAILDESGNFIVTEITDLLTQEATIVNASANYLNNSVLVPDEARVSSLNGQVGRVRFWTKALDIDEWTEHVLNPHSLGTKNPLKNFSFNTKTTGSFERLRMDLSLDQDIRTTATDGQIQLIDYSQNGLHWAGFSFPSASNVFATSLWSYGFISPAFDEAVTNDKVRIRSFLNYKNVQQSDFAETAPVYRINPSERPTDDTRFSIEFSLIDALNRDIIKIFATLESLDNALGNPELVYSPDYPTLEAMRRMYFNRLTDKMNVKSFFEFFRWFETSIGGFIEQLIPRKTRFFGTNFVIESHMLERPKMEYNSSDMYMTAQTRSPTKDTLLLQQVAGTLRKY